MRDLEKFTSPNELPKTEVDANQIRNFSTDRARGEIIQEIDPIVSQINGTKAFWRHTKAVVGLSEELVSAPESFFDDGNSKSPMTNRATAITACALEICYCVDHLTRNIKSSNQLNPAIESNLRSITPFWAKIKVDPDDVQPPKTLESLLAGGVTISKILYKLNDITNNKNRSVNVEEYSFLSYVIRKQVEKQAKEEDYHLVDMLSTLIHTTKVDHKNALSKYGKKQISNGSNYLTLLRNLVDMTYDGIIEVDSPTNDIARNILATLSFVHSDTDIGKMLANGYVFREWDYKTRTSSEYARRLESTLEEGDSEIVSSFLQNMKDILNKYDYVCTAALLEEVMAGELNGDANPNELGKKLKTLKALGNGKITFEIEGLDSIANFKKGYSGLQCNLAFKGQITEARIKLLDADGFRSISLFIEDADNETQIYPYLVDIDQLKDGVRQRLKIILSNIVDRHLQSLHPREEKKYITGSFVPPPAREKRSEIQRVYPDKKKKGKDDDDLVSVKFVEDILQQRYRPRLVCDDSFWSKVDLPTHIIEQAKRKIEDYNEKGIGLFKALTRSHAGPNGELVYSLRVGDYRVLSYKKDGNIACLYDVIHRRNL